MYSPKTAAANFIHELGKSRAKGHLPMLMELVQKAFQDYLVSRPPLVTAQGLPALGALRACMHWAMLPRVACRGSCSFCQQLCRVAGDLTALLHDCWHAQGLQQAHC